MSFYEIIIAITVVLITICFYTMVIEKDNYNMGKFIVLFLSICPIVLFSIIMVSDTITADEYQYMDVIVDMSNILEQPAVASKLMLQYRTSQMIFGTIFKLIPRVYYNNLDKTNLIIIYKLLHWILFYIVGLLICTVIYKKYLLHKSENIYKKIMAWLVTFYMVLGLPMTISVIKVCNYDATNVMFATLGIALIGTYVLSVLEKNNSNEKYALLGILCCVMGCLDKWSSAIYFMIGAILYCFADLVKENTFQFVHILRKSLISVAKVVLIGLFCGWINLEYIKIFLVNGGLYEDIKFGHIAFSYTNLFSIVFEGAAAQVSGYAIQYIGLLCLLILICTIFLYAMFHIIYRGKNTYRGGVYCLGGIILLVVIVLGICGSYFVPQRMHPYDMLKEGELSASTLWGQYHYGAYTIFSHKLLQCVYAFATILSNLPTAACMMLLAGSILIIRKRNSLELWYMFVIMACIAVVIILACMDQPSDPRYFGVPILCAVLSIWVAIYNEGVISIKFEKRVLTVVLVMGCVWNMELAVYQPNIKIFAPIWLVRSQDFNQSVRLGQWYAGEAMSWGEELALAGKKINTLVRDNEIEDVTIYSNYGITWLKNPGYVLKHMGEVDEFTKFDATSYFVLTKKALFRMPELPPFITEVEPVTTVEYRGEICSWIYSGEQLLEYKDYFLEGT